MSCTERDDDFATRREPLRGLSDEALRALFWQRVEQIVAPLVEEARTHTTPSIERSVLLRMGLSSVEAKTLVARMHERGLLGHGAGRLVLDVARTQAVSPRDAALALLDGRHWEGLPG